MSILLFYGGIFLGILILAIVFKLIKGLLKTIFFISFIFIIFLFITGFFVIKDAKDFQNNFSTKENIYFMTINNSIITGFSVEGINFSTTNFFSEKELSTIIGQINKKNISDEEYYKIISFDFSLFDEILSEGINYEGFIINKSLAEKMFNSTDPLTELAKSEDKDNWNDLRDLLSDKFNDSSEVKSSLFSILILESFVENNNFLLNNIKSDDLSIKPETPLFIAMKFIPKSLFEKFLITNNTKEVLNETKILG